LAYDPQNSGTIEEACPTWNKVLSHCGIGLDESIQKNEWCKANGVMNGRDYLFLWIASIFQLPAQPLPYLFFHGPQNSGKSTFHEGLLKLFKNQTGVVRADNALTSDSRFNGELLGAVLCIVEETNLQLRGGGTNAYNRVKDWVTSPSLLIHVKGKTPFMTQNTTHWIQCSNEQDACPVFPNDTRITMTFVDELDCIIPKESLLRSLDVEAPSFLHLILNTEIPATTDRLRIPVVSSPEKLMISQMNELAVDQFFRDFVYSAPGHAVELGVLYQAFYNWIPFEQKRIWPQRRFYSHIPKDVIKGKYKGAYYYAGNISLESDTIPKKELILMFDKLIENTNGRFAK
jgi:energy-coupling factor transporter ATP-binding protein EcfA2